MTKSAPYLIRLLTITLMLLVFAGLVTPYLDRTIQYDEAYTVRYFAVSPERAIFSYTDPNNHMLHSFILWMTNQVLGTSTVAVRLPAFTFALLSLAMVFRLGRALISFEGGLIAAALLGINLTFADYAVNARGYTLSIFLALALIQQVFNPRLRPLRRIRWVPLFTSAALVLTLPTMVILIAGVVLYLFLQSNQLRKRAYTELIPPLVVGALAGGTFYLPSLFYGELGEQFGRFGLNSPLDLAGEWIRLSFPTPVLSAVATVISIIGLIVVFTSARYKRLREIILFTFAPAVMLALFQWVLTGRLFFGRNYLYLTAVLCLAGGAFFFVLQHKDMRLRVPVSVLVFVLLFAAALPYQSLGAMTEVDTVLSYVRAQVQPNDAIFMGCCVEEPVIYHVVREDNPAILIPADETRRLWVLATAFHSFDELIALYDVGEHVSNCQPADSWEPFTVYLCAYQP